MAESNQLVSHRAKKLRRIAFETNIQNAVKVGASAVDGAPEKHGNTSWTVMLLQWKLDISSLFVERRRYSASQERGIGEHLRQEIVPIVLGWDMRPQLSKSLIASTTVCVCLHCEHN